MNGTVIPNTPIAVDFWQARQTCGIRLFFLSHLHSDHIKGLTSSWSQPIYCSPLTGQLLLHKLHIREELLRLLEVNTCHIVPLDDLSEQTVTVTVIDANHCPGSVMFLFEGGFGSILYTGDFRYESLDQSPPVKLLESKKVDVLYLDNTYCDPRCEFPSRSHCKQRIIKLIEEHPDHNVVIGFRNLGKEQLLVDLAFHFNTWIVIDQDQLEKMKILELPNVFTTDPEAGFIRVELFHAISSSKIHTWNCDVKTLVILPTSLYEGLDIKPYSNCPDTHIIPYSDHSSYSELHAFVRAVAPKCVRPIVSSGNRGVFGLSVQNRADMSCFKHYLNQSPLKPIRNSSDIMKTMCVNKANSKKRKIKPLWLQAKHTRIKGVVFDEDSDPNHVQGSELGDARPNVHIDTKKIDVSNNTDAENITSLVQKTSDCWCNLTEGDREGTDSSSDPHSKQSDGSTNCMTECEKPSMLEVVHWNSNTKDSDLSICPSQSNKQQCQTDDVDKRHSLSFVSTETKNVIDYFHWHQSSQQNDSVTEVINELHLKDISNKKVVQTNDITSKPLCISPVKTTATSTMYIMTNPVRSRWKETLVPSWHSDEEKTTVDHHILSKVDEYAQICESVQSNIKGISVLTDSCVLNQELSCKQRVQQKQNVALCLAVTPIQRSTKQQIPSRLSILPRKPSSREGHTLKCCPLTDHHRHGSLPMIPASQLEQENLILQEIRKGRLNV